MEGNWEVFETPDIAVVEGEGSSSTSTKATPSFEQVNDPENVIPTPLNADAAFEVFHGKRYQTSHVDLSGSIARPTGHTASRTTTVDTSILPSQERPLETPIQRYLRLKAEASQLAEEVEALVAAGGSGGGVEGEIDLEPAVLWKHLAEDVGNLRGELTILSQGPGAKILGGPAAGGSGGEAAQIEGDLAEALMKKVGDLTINNKKAATVGAGAGGKDAAASGQVIYELYYDPSRAASQQIRIAQIQALDGRLAALERVLIRTEEDDAIIANAAGEAAGMVLASKSLPLVDAIAKVEKQAVLLDAVSVETLRQRLALLKNEWDDFKKERVKHGHNLERDASNHYRKIEALYDQLQKLEHVESDLPGLVSRLQVLQDLHTQSLQFNQRLVQLEGGQEVLKSLLTNTGQSLTEVKKSLTENVQQMATNIKVVDGRIEEALAKHRGKG